MKAAIKPLAPKIFKSFLNEAVDTILPPRCIVTGDMVDRQGMVAPQVWKDLSFIADPKCGRCGFPFDFEVEAGSLCASCLDYPPKFESARAALKYDDTSRGIILGFKHGDKLHAAKAFVPWLKMAGAEMLDQADVLLPVPLHPWRLLKRKYNQAAVMAAALSKDTNIPIIYDGLRRTRSTPPQGHLSSKERYRNVKSAFAVNEKQKARMRGKSIVLIDDVYTTGATVNECTKALYKAGVARVNILTLARVARDGFG